MLYAVQNGCIIEICIKYLSANVMQTKEYIDVKYIKRKRSKTCFSEDFIISEMFQ